MRELEKNWWTLFMDKNKDDKLILGIIESINDQEEKMDKEEVLKIGKKINRLDVVEYPDEIRNLRKRYNVLENRVQRQISDDFGILLRYLRKKKDLSLSKLGEMTGISPSYINRLELNQRKSPSINIMESLAKALEVPLSVLAQAAGIEFNESKMTNILNLIDENDISLGHYQKILNPTQKKKFKDLIGFIINESWGNDREEEVGQLINLMDEFRQEIE